VLIAQITDCHIGFFSKVLEGVNTRRLRVVLERLCDGPNRPDVLLMTGDLTANGDAESYARLAGLLAACPFPVHLLPGNHDARDALLAAFPRTKALDGFIQYDLALKGLRVIGIDTLEPGRHGGAFCARRAEWLRARLDADSETPVLIAMHHPPVETGIGWLDCDEQEPWIARFTETIAGRPQVRAIVAGHMHRTIHTSFAGMPLTVCPSSAGAVALDLSPLDPAAPDGRAMVIGEPAGYALHRWDGRRFTSHFEAVSADGVWDVLARYDEGMQQVVRSISGERPVR
jgi:3',5'-cyclic-AMP phosphodiesterase